jgi:hypothetical protein
MARNRVIYQSEALFVSTTGGDTFQQIIRTQDVSHAIDVPRTDINEFGRLAALSREVVEPPTVSTDFTYYLTNGINESGLGFSVRGMTNDSATNCVSGLIGDDNDIIKKNYYIVTSAEGVDATNNTGTWATRTTRPNSVIGVGNAFITDYTLNAAVGDVPSASISVEGANINFTTGYSAKPEFTPAVGWYGSTVDADITNGSITGIANPGVNETNGTVLTEPAGGILVPGSTTGDLNITALRPGDITLSFTNALLMGGANLTDLHVQNFSFSLPIGRTALNQIGNRYPYFRAVDFPVVATMNVSAILADNHTGNLNALLCNEQKHDITVKMYKPCEQDVADGEAFRVTMKGADVDSENLSSSIGDNKTVDLVFSTQIGGPNDIVNGVFMSGNRDA